MARRIWRREMNPGELYYDQEDGLYFITMGGGGAIWGDDKQFFIDEYGYTGSEVVHIVGGLEDE